MSSVWSSARLYARPWTPTDAPLAEALWCDATVMRFLGGPLTTDAARERLDAEMRLWERHGVQYWPVFRHADHTFVGCAGLRPWSDDRDTLEVGVHLLPAFWRQGLAREATQAVIQHAFHVRGVRRLFAGHHPEHQRSRAVLTGLGFVYSHDERYPPTGRNHPSYFLNA